MRTPVLARTRAELAEAQHRRNGRLGLVMTMGALHEGHVSLLRAARNCDIVVATIFVNPLQFGPNEDFDGYPRPLEADLGVCAAEGVDIVFAPPRAEVYRDAEQVTVDPGPLGRELEGAARPGHLAGVLTVVNKMVHIVSAVDSAFFGEKDYQQLTLVRRMAADFDLPVHIAGLPTVREPDGLALSSRNRYLTRSQRHAGLALSAALRAGVSVAAAGTDRDGVLRAARAVLDAEPGLELDYLALRAPDLGPAPSVGEVRLLVAAKVGSTRLLDNLPVRLQAR